MQLGLEGLGVLVTGGAGGIGAATVRAFAAEGWVASPAAGHTTGEIIPVSGGMDGPVLW